MSLLNVTVHPALQSVQIPIRDAMARCGMTCPVKTVGSPGIVISQLWVDLTFRPAGMLIVKGLLVILLLTTSTPSKMKMGVNVIMIAFRYSCDGWLNMLQAIAAIDCVETKGNGGDVD